jgi:1-acyl-sn-glycerol-3-phosphate acyltransferase
VLVFFRILRPPLMLFFLIATCLMALITLPLKKIGLYVDYQIIKYWARITCRIYSINIHIENQVNTVPSIIISDHISYWDILTMGASFKGFFVSKATVKDWPLIGWGARLVRTIFITREHKIHAIETLNRDAKQIIEQKDSVIVFAEGTTSKNPCKLFKRGAFNLSIANNTPVKPVALYYDRMDIISWIDDESFVHHLLRMTFTPGINCYIYEFPLIYPKDFKSVDEMRAYCQNIIQKKIDEYRSRAGEISG